MTRYGSLLLGCVLPMCAAGQSHSDPVVMIAINGLRPGDLTSDATKDWHVPVLRGLIRNGAAASGVRGVLPTLTLPSMMTLVTGTSPGHHGVVNNVQCGEEARANGGYYWYARNVKVETLWEAARRKGLKTANVGWTSTVGASVDRNLAEVWPATSGSQYALQDSSSTPGLLAQLDPRAANAAGSYLMDDDRRTVYAETLMASYRPDLLTVFYENVDNMEHKTGLDTPEDRHALEHIDSLVGRLVSAARRQHPGVTIVVVSDHGFASASTDINLIPAFANAGLLSLDQGAVKSWTARPCGAGGSAYVVLADSTNATVKSRVAALLERLRTDQANGIDRVLGRAAIQDVGGWKQADFMVLFRPGYVAARSAAAPLRATSQYRGMHGYWPADPGMYATFIIAGSNVPLKGDLGVVDMRNIGPTVAALLGTRLTSATGKSLF